ncbi:FecR family protein [Mangrovibacterium diazotrophicum]|nr:FecR domain-containing protein [Mangrovibacterium diazotrophicum]
MESKKDHIDLLPDYFAGVLSEEERVAVEKWKNASDENLQIFQESEKVYYSLDLLEEMKHYDSSLALHKLNERVRREYPVQRLLYYWQRAAAILILPLLIASVYFFIDRKPQQGTELWLAYHTPPGVKSEVYLPDGTSVFLNSDTKLEYPSSFSGKERRVTLNGEAFFKVAKDAAHPFVVGLGKIGVEVKGTEFNVCNYPDEDKTEVVLKEGKVDLIEINTTRNALLVAMKPGEQAVFKRTEEKVVLREVDVDRYIGWIDGLLIFRDDRMTEVVRSLERWYNVNILIEDPEIEDYIFTGTFKHETITQVLDLLKRTSPFEYDILPSKKQQNGVYEKQKIVLTKSSK